MTKYLYCKSLFLFSFLLFSCIEREKKVIVYIQNSCILTEPVYNCANIIEWEDKISKNYKAPNLQEAILSLIDRVKGKKMQFELEPLVFDSTKSFVTAFSQQRVLSIEDECLDSLEFPEKIFSYENQCVNSIEKITFEKVEKRKIPDYGDCIIYYYTNITSSNSMASRTNIFVQDVKSGKNPNHFIFYSDGIEWEKLPDGYSSPYFVNIGRDLYEEILLAYDGHRFIPVGSRKGK